MSQFDHKHTEYTKDKDHTDDDSSISKDVDNVNLEELFINKRNSCDDEKKLDMQDDQNYIRGIIYSKQSELIQFNNSDYECSEILNDMKHYSVSTMEALKLGGISFADSEKLMLNNDFKIDTHFLRILIRVCVVVRSIRYCSNNLVDVQQNMNHNWNKNNLFRLKSLDMNELESIIYLSNMIDNGFLSRDICKIVDYNSLKLRIRLTINKMNNHYLWMDKLIEIMLMIFLSSCILFLSSSPSYMSNRMMGYGGNHSLDFTTHKIKGRSDVIRKMNNQLVSKIRV